MSTIDRIEAMADDLEGVGDFDAARLLRAMCAQQRGPLSTVTLRSIDGGRLFWVKADGMAGPGLIAGTPVLRAMHAAIAQPRTLAPLPPGASSTWASRRDAAIQRLDGAVPGLAAALKPDKSRSFGISICREGIVYVPRRPGPVIQALTSGIEESSFV